MAPGEYVLGERETMGVNTSFDARFLNDEAIVKVRFRGDAAPAWKSAGTPKDGGPMQSAFVVLGAR